MVVNIRFSAKKTDFHVFYFHFCFISTVYTIVGHTHILEFHSLDSFLNKKNENQTPPLHSIETETSHKPYLTIW